MTKCVMQGPDLVTTSSELIYSGELTKVSVHGWHQDRFFFLFDHLVVYLKKVRHLRLHFAFTQNVLGTE